MKILSNIAELVKVKSLITLAMIGALVYGFVVGKVESELFAALAGSIITYYFTKAESEGR